MQTQQHLIQSPKAQTQSLPLMFVARDVLSLLVIILLVIISSVTGMP